MIAVDASAILAILLQEQDANAFSDLLTVTGGVISPVNRWEVLSRAYKFCQEPAVKEARELLDTLGVVTGTSSARESDSAFEAFRRYGKGNGGPLNLGDCFAYALAQAEGDGLLFKGDDFRRTDVRAVL